MAKQKVLNEQELHNRIQESSLSYLKEYPSKWQWDQLTHLAETQKVKLTLDNLMLLAVTLNSDLAYLNASSD